MNREWTEYELIELDRVASRLEYPEEYDKDPVFFDDTYRLTSAALREFCKIQRTV